MIEKTSIWLNVSSIQNEYTKCIKQQCFLNDTSWADVSNDIKVTNRKTIFSSLSPFYNFYVAVCTWYLTIFKRLIKATF